MRLSLLIFLSLVTGSAFAAADLEIKTLKGTPSSQQFVIEFQVINHGPAVANKVGCNVYFYANERLVLSQAASLAPLAVGASRKETLTVDSPTTAVTTVKVEIFDSEQPDTQPSTNFLQMNLKPPHLLKADLQIVDVKMEEAKEKGKGGFLVRLRNNGPDRVPISRLNVELEVFGEAIASSEKRVDRMGPGGEMETRVQIPNAGIITSTNGSLTLRWNAEVEDVDAANNIFKIPVPLTLRMPDLLPVRIAVDRMGVLTFAITNKGNARSSATVTALYINGALVERFPTQEIGPRGTHPFRYNTMKLSPQDKIAVVSDFNADVEEASEENNRATPVATNQ